MRVKDMFLKNDKYLLNLIISVFFLFSYKAHSETNDKTKALNYLNSLKYFSASFLQNDGENLSEGKFYIGKNRVRAEYFFPTKILLILDQDKAMYYDYELEEDEFFDPKKTNAWFFYDVFRNPSFFEDAIVEIYKNELLIQKSGVDSEEKKFVISVYFEKNPIVLRRIDIALDDNILSLSIFNHSYNEEFNEDFFKLINPRFLN